MQRTAIILIAKIDPRYGNRSLAYGTTRRIRNSKRIKAIVTSATTKDEEIYDFVGVTIKYDNDEDISSDKTKIGHGQDETDLKETGFVGLATIATTR
ncbi:hypothetical protein N7517_010686 [Penicillium concentricum]|uniref:Uncharacterized protein n=1 Tax=Penicillium concentricum TaxID=293559 RepID=A0A9W9R9G0_9EURO|nr:uncharacterized protein N7517_010686 [Penicillium concentricum]KAJ5356077.1 hypothetical protein N7517_010686 [Penicillium concentricum]